MRFGKAAALATMAAAFTVLSGQSAAAVSGLVNQTLAQVRGQVLVPDQYIVTLNKPADGSLLAGLSVADQAAALTAGVGGGQVLMVYEHALRGFAARMTAAQATLLAAHPLVASVAQDQIGRIRATQNGATWGLDRVDQRTRPMDGKYSYPDSAGAGIHVYVLDTGLNVNHNDFTGRVGAGRNFADRRSASVIGGIGGSGSTTITPTDVSDCNGHGTHVAGTTSGTTWGVAKKSTVHPVRVLNCGGEGQFSWIIGGIDWVTANAVRPAVANMSLGGGNDDALDTAVRNSINSGITYAIAAGNDSANACTGSPNRVAEAITVGATQNNDAMASYSNFGPCVDLFAPGSAITSASHANNTGSANLDGTSMASPHVAGAAALVLARNSSQTPAQIAQVLVNEATTGVLTALGTGSPNRLLYVSNSGGSAPVDSAPLASFSVACTNLACTFTSTSTDDKGIASLAWNFGDGTSGSGSPVSRTYAAAGSYTVVLTVTDTIGQTASSSQPVAVTAASSGPCSDCTKVSGTLASGGTAYSPDANGAARNAGQFKGYLRGPAGSDFDLFLEKRGTNVLGQVTWSIVARAETTSTNEDIVYSGTAGTYRWRIKSYSGAGAYDFYFKNP